METNLPDPPPITLGAVQNPFYTHRAFTSLEQLAIYGTNRELAYWMVSFISTQEQFDFIQTHFAQETSCARNPIQFRMFLYLVSQIYPA